MSLKIVSLKKHGTGWLIMDRNHIYKGPYEKEVDAYKQLVKELKIELRLTLNHFKMSEKLLHETNTVIAKVHKACHDYYDK